MDPVHNTSKDPESTISPREEQLRTAEIQQDQLRNDLGESKCGTKPTQKVKPNIIKSNLHPTVGEPPKREPLPKKPKELSSACGRQWIRREYPMVMRKRLDHLGVSAQFRYVTMDVKLHNEGCIMATDDNFVAQVQIDEPELLDGIAIFEDARMVLLEQLRIVKVMRDDLREERDRLRAELIPVISDAMQDSAFEWERARNCIQLFKLKTDLMKSDRLSYRRLCRDISTNQTMTKDLRKFAKRLLEIEETIIKRNKWFNRFGLGIEQWQSQDLDEQLETVLRETINNHRQLLEDYAPEFLKKLLKELNQHQILMINSEDVLTFANLENSLQTDLFKKPLEDLAKRWIHKLPKNHLNNRPTLTNSVFLTLCSSLQCIIFEISLKSKTSQTELLLSDSNGWHPAKTIMWNFESCYNTCLELEYRYIFQLLNHFAFTNPERKPFLYYPLVLNWFSKSAHINETKTLIRFHSKQKNPFDIPEEIYVWYCMVDTILSETPVVKTKPRGTFDQFYPTFRFYTEKILECNSDDAFWIFELSHSLLHYIMQIDQLSKNSPICGDLYHQLMNESYDCIYLEKINSRISILCFWNEGLNMLEQNSHLPGLKKIFELSCEIGNIVSKKIIERFVYSDFHDVMNKFAVCVVQIQQEERIKDFIDPNSLSPHYEYKSIIEILNLMLHVLRLNGWPLSACYDSDFSKICSVTIILKAFNKSMLLLMDRKNSFELLYKNLIEPIRNAFETSPCEQTFSDRVYEIEDRFQKKLEISKDKSSTGKIIRNDTEWICYILIALAFILIGILIKKIEEVLAYQYNNQPNWKTMLFRVFQN